MPSFKDLMRIAEKKAESDVDSGGRLREIVEIVARHDIHEGLTPQKTVDILQDLGATFVKLGQIASTHPDILPMEYCDALGELRANVAPMPVEVVRARIEEELGAPVDELFSEFDDAALGSASIGQVHRAVIRKTGQEVAVKVQRPGVVETVTRDLALMKKVVGLQNLLTHGEGQISLKELVDELERTSVDELDYRIEAGNLARFCANNEGRAGVSSLRCHPDYSTAAVITMDFARGPRVGEIDSLGLTDQQRDALAYLIAQNYVEQVLRDGFFHADPHAGNILLVEGVGVDAADAAETDGRDAAGLMADIVTPFGEKLLGVSLEQMAVPGLEGLSAAGPDLSALGGLGIQWIDFGMMGSLSSSMRESLMDVVLAIVKGDAYGLKRNIFKIATPTGPVDHGVLLATCEQLMDSYVDVDLAEFDTAKLMESLVSSMQGQGFDVDPSVLMLGRGLVTLEGTIHLVSPNLNIMEVLARYIRTNADPARIQQRIRKVVGRGIESAEAAVALPSKASETLDMLQKGHLKLHMDLGAETKLAAQLRAGLDHFSLVLMAAALFLGSCVLCLTELAPKLLGVPLLGLVGFVVGIAIMVFVLVDIVRKRKG